MLTMSSWRARFARLSDTTEIAERVGGQMSDYQENKDIGWYRHQGDLVVPDNLDLDVALVVDGDLVVHGFLDDYVSDIGMLVVLGDLVVHDLVSWGSVYVEGDLWSHGIVYGYYNDFTFEVDGEVHARVLAMSDKSADYHCGEVTAEIDSYVPTKAQFRAAREILVPQVYDDWKERSKMGKQPRLAYPSYHRVCDRLHAGKPLFQDGR
jgi:hypothetical protein